MVLANGQIAHWVVSVFSAVPFLIFLTICRDKLKSNQEHIIFMPCALSSVKHIDTLHGTQIRAWSELMYQKLFLAIFFSK